MEVVITGGSSGLGKALVYALKGNEIHNWSKDTGVDVTDRASVRTAAEKVGRCEILINCAGINYIDWFPKITDETFDELMAINAKAFMVTAQELLEKMQGGTICNIVSNASHIPMTHSVAYNASKGAAHIMTLQMARELKKTHDITVFGVSPNKMHSTGMTDYIDARVCELRGWSPEEARKYQLQSLPAGIETDPETVAEFIAFLLSKKHRHIFLNGCILPYGA